jgi:hypothetical protein
MRTFVLLSLLLAACEQPPPQPQITHLPVAREAVCPADTTAATMACMQALYDRDDEVLRELRWQQRLRELEERRKWRERNL